MSFLSDSSKSTSGTSNFSYKRNVGPRSDWIHKTTIESTPSLSESEREISYKKLENSTNQQNIEISEWNSHLNMQQIAKNRTKMKTPNSDEIESYAKACRAEFERKQAKSHEALRAKVLRKHNGRDIPIYTKPYSSDSYSDVPIRPRASTARIIPKTSAIIDVYKSFSESDGFLSSNSISIAVAANSTSNTTTHQYDSKISVGIQTSDTLTRMQPIHLKTPCDNDRLETIVENETPITTSTIRVNRLTFDKRLQVRPDSLAYVITFKDQKKKVVDQNANSKSTAKERGNALYENRINQNNRIGNNTSSSASSKDNFDARQTKSKRKLQQNNSNSCSGSSTTSSMESFTLQEYLQIRRPDFYANAEQRRQCMNDLHNLR